MRIINQVEARDAEGFTALHWAAAYAARTPPRRRVG